MKTFVDNVCKQVVERHILGGLPDIFSPVKVATYSDETLQKTASEQAPNVQKRAQLKTLLGGLQESLIELRR